VRRPGQRHELLQTVESSMADTVRRNWSLEDDTGMLTAIEKNQSIAETAQLLGRKPDEVRERLSMLMREATGLFPKDLAAS